MSVKVIVKKINIFFIILVLIFFSYSLKTLAHGSIIDYRSTKAIQVQASYDDGLPIANGQVIVYAPNNPTTPWLKGETDSKGHFFFIPDESLSGNWDVKVRKAGHGSIVSIPLTPDSDANSESIASKETQWQSSSNGGYTPLQKLVMASVSIWGFIGTALFFYRKKVES